MNNPFQDKPLLEDWQKPKVLAIIPARGGSKGIPRKNIQDLCGKPLIAYSIEVALKARMIDRVVVSTDDEEIAETSRHSGAEVPFLRPKEMAADRSSVGDAIDFTVKNLRNDGYKPQLLVTLYPTNPFRTPALVDFLVQKMINGSSPVTTVKWVPHHPFSIFSRNEHKRIVPLLHANFTDGTVSRKSFFRQYGLFLGEIYGSSTNRPYVHLIKDPVSLIDIDSITDFYLAEQVITRGLFDFDIGYTNAGNNPYFS